MVFKDNSMLSKPFLEYYKFHVLYILVKNSVVIQETEVSFFYRNGYFSNAYGFDLKSSS